MNNIGEIVTASHHLVLLTASTGPLSAFICLCYIVLFRHTFRVSAIFVLVSSAVCGWACVYMQTLYVYLVKFTDGHSMVYAYIFICTCTSEQWSVSLRPLCTYGSKTLVDYPGMQVGDPMIVCFHLWVKFQCVCISSCVAGLMSVMCVLWLHVLNHYLTCICNTMTWYPWHGTNAHIRTL